MNRYQSLRLIRDSIAQLPGLRGHNDFDLIVEIAYHQFQGAPLTMKQLMLLDIASTATIRRHISRLTQNGTIVKVIPPNDHRVALLTLDPALIEALDLCLGKLHAHLCDCMGETHD